MMFTGQVLENEEYSCSCENYTGFDEQWRCKNCGRRVIISGDYHTWKTACYRITPPELREGMRLYYDGDFYEVLRIFPPQTKKDCQYINLRGFGSHKINLHNFVLVQA